MYNVYDIEDITEEKQEFVIDTDLKAEWAINIIKQEQKEQNRLLNVIDEEILRLKAKRDAIAENDKTKWLRGKLFEYFTTVQPRDLKTCQKYELPNGSLVLKKPKISYERDDNAILEWLNEHNKYDYIKVTHSVDWSALKDAVFFDDVAGIKKVETTTEFEVK